MLERERCFSMGKAALSGPVAVDEENLEAAAKNSAGRRWSKNETCHGTRLNTAQKGSPWFCYAGPLAERQKIGISGNWQRLKLTPCERNS